MKYILIRHAKTEANRSNRALFGQNGASINDEGLRQAVALHGKLVNLGVDFKQSVAVSEKIRTQNTANVAGFEDFKIYKTLGEVETTDVEKTFKLIGRGELPIEAIRAAEKIIANPPEEKIWFTHGLVIAALQIVLNQKQANLIPDLCEVREIEF